MSLTKTPDEISKMRVGGHLLSRALGAAVAVVRPGITLREVDAVGEKVILDGGGKPSFKGYRGSPRDTPFPSTLCLSVNEEVVHGLGNRDRVLKEGDIIGLDIGCWYDGLCTDMAVTVPVGKVSPEATKLMDVTRKSLEAGVSVSRVGGSIKDISAAVENYVKPFGYGIVRALVGHGVGHAVHEAPHVPNFVSSRYPNVEIKNGICLAIEPMLGMGGNDEVDTAADG